MAQDYIADLAQLGSTAELLKESNIPLAASCFDKHKEALAILRVLHQEDRNIFRKEINPLLLPEEERLIKVAESAHLCLQAVCVFKDVIRRLTYRWAEIVEWPMSKIAEVVEPPTQITSSLRCVVLDMPMSRSLHGHTAFKISNPKFVPDQFPASGLEALADSLRYWKKTAYLEPVFGDKGQILRSIRDVRRWCRPKDPLLVGWLGSGPSNFGYSAGELWDYRRPTKEQERVMQMRSVVFIVAHWD